MLDHPPHLTRREQEKRETRAAILAAARTIAAEEGWEAVSTRRLAEAIQYSLPTLYQYFESKAALLAEINREGYRELLVRLRTARARAATPEAGAVEMARAYCNFAWGQREYYQVMLGQGGVVLAPETYADEARAALAEARSALVAWADSEGVMLVEPDDAVQLLWATLHGIASLALARQSIGGKKRAALLAVRAVDNLLTAWRSEGKV
jgi:AcrR family transcriptional regulator